MKKLNWRKKKPQFTEECLLLVASFDDVNKFWNYSLFEISKITCDEGWYYGVCQDGKEWGDYYELEAELYCKLPKLT